MVGLYDPVAEAQRFRQVDSAGNALDETGGAASENQLGFVSLNTVVISLTPTITNGAYSAGDVIGGEQTLTNVFRISGGAALLKSITIMDSGNQKAAMDLLFFDADPTNGQADNAAYAWNAADFAKLVAWVPIAAASYVTIATEAVYSLQCEIPVQGNATTNLYLIIVTSGTPTYTSTSDLKFRFGLIRS